MTAHHVTHATFVLDRHYDAAPARVFAAFADPAVKRRWFGEADGWEDATHDLDFRVGGRETSSARQPGGPAHVYEARYVDVVPDRRIVLAYDMHLGGPRISVSLVTVELRPENGGTRLRYTEQAAFLDGHDDVGAREEGTRFLLDALGTELRRTEAAA